MSKSRLVYWDLFRIIKSIRLIRLIFYRILIIFFTKNIPVRTSIERPTNSKYISVETGKILKIPAETG